MEEENVRSNVCKEFITLNYHDKREKEKDSETEFQSTKNILGRDKIGMIWNIGRGMSSKIWKLEGWIHYSVKESSRIE